jgi:hypothetical protein
MMRPTDAVVLFEQSTSMEDAYMSVVRFRQRQFGI